VSSRISDYFGGLRSGGASNKLHRLHKQIDMGNSLNCCGIVLARNYDEVAAEDANNNNICISSKQGVKYAQGGESVIELENVQVDNNGKIIQMVDNNNKPIVIMHANKNNSNNNNSISSMLFGFMKKSGDGHEENHSSPPISPKDSHQM
jgi:hypothetical protein